MKKNFETESTSQLNLFASSNFTVESQQPNNNSTQPSVENTMTPDTKQELGKVISIVTSNTRRSEIYDSILKRTMS